MSKEEILAELPRLGSADRREILDLMWELEEKALFSTEQPDAAERALLDQAIEEYEKNPGGGSTWEEVEARIPR